VALTAIVLCGGQSTRMGSDKASLPFGNETMLERISRTVAEVADALIVVGRRDQDASTTYDAIEEQGPLAGIAAGLSASKTDLNVIIACDMPLIKPVVLQRLVSLIDNNDICVAVVDGHASALCGVYRSRIAGDAQALLDAGERRVMRLLDRVQTKRVDTAAFRDIDPNLDTFLSCDTPEAYRAALVRLKPDASGSRR
jgi:molybdopterin-guanine dinucleotide biosynthesis protein A